MNKNFKFIKILSSIFSLFVVLLALNAQNLASIDLTRAKFGIINADEIFEKFEFIPLETHKKGLLKVNEATFYLTEKYIIGMNFLGPAYLFERKTGAFIREISSRGRGPDEYTGWLSNQYGFDETNNILFADVGSDSKPWKCINIETNKVESIINKPLSENNNEIFPAYVPWLIKDNVYVSFCNNLTGKDNIKLIVYNKEGTLIKIYPNHLEYKKLNARVYPSFYGIFYYYNGLTYFKEYNYNDTIYCVNEKNLTPHIIFNLGDKQPSYYHQENIDHSKGKYLIKFVCESNKIIMFNFVYNSYDAETIEFLGSKTLRKGQIPNLHTGYYDKKSKQVFISSAPNFKTSGYTISGIPISIHPISINKNNEMIAKIDPADLLEHEDKIGSKYKHIFKNIQEEDNPVVVIAKVK